MSFPPRVPRHCVSWSNRQAWAWPTETIRRIWLARTHCHKRTAKQTEAKFVLEHVSIWCCAYSIGHRVWYGPQEGNGEVCWSPVRLSIYRTQPEDICFVKKKHTQFLLPTSRRMKCPVLLFIFVDTGRRRFTQNLLYVTWRKSNFWRARHLKCLYAPSSEKSAHTWAERRFMLGQPSIQRTFDEWKCNPRHPMFKQGSQAEVVK